MRAEIRNCVATFAGAARLRRVAVLAAASVAATCVIGAASAQANNLFKLDASADSGAQIVVDGAGNGYVAWLRKSTPNDLVMFCKIAAKAKRCKSPVNLPLPVPDADSAGTDQPFAVLGASGQVWVVAPRYDLGDIVYWLSTNGGASFAAPVDVAVAGDFADDTTVSDILLDPVEPTLGADPPVAYFDIASVNPGLGYSWLPTNLTSGGSPTSFSFDTTGAVSGATLGEQPDGFPLEAYWTLGTGGDSGPDEVYYFRQTVANGFEMASDAWTSTPTQVGPGYLPSLASGPKGLFLAYSAYDSEKFGSETPSAITVLHYLPTIRNFGPAAIVYDDNQKNVSAGYGGAINENAKTGELGLIWPEYHTAKGTVLRLWTSKDGGARYSKKRLIAKLGAGYTGNISLALNAKGGGFVAYQNSSGLQIANLAALPAPKKKKK